MREKLEIARKRRVAGVLLAAISLIPACSSDKDVQSVEGIEFAEEVFNNEEKAMLNEAYTNYTDTFGCKAPTIKIGRVAIPKPADNITALAKSRPGSIDFNQAIEFDTKTLVGTTYHELTHACPEDVLEIDPNTNRMVAADGSPIVRINGFNVQTQAALATDGWFIGMEEGVADIASYHIGRESGHSSRYNKWTALIDGLMQRAGLTIEEVIEMQRSNDVFGFVDSLLPSDELPELEKLNIMIWATQEVGAGLITVEELLRRFDVNFYS